MHLLDMLFSLNFAPQTLPMVQDKDMLLLESSTSVFELNQISLVYQSCNNLLLFGETIICSW